MKVHFYASGSHYLDHMVPIIKALPDTYRGLICVSQTIELYAKARLEGFDIRVGIPPHYEPCVIASFGDYQAVGGGRRIALVEHGAGQTYCKSNGVPDRHPSNPGGMDREGINLFICPNESVAMKNNLWYPESEWVIAGSPRVDELRSLVASGGFRAYSTLPGDLSAPEGILGGSKRPLVSFAFHWPNSQCTESMWAYPHFAKILPSLQEKYDVIVHAHPRIFNRVYDDLSGRNMRLEPRFEGLLGSDILCVDNSSVGPEWAACTGRPILWMNAPWYRKNLNHGGRFWEWVDGQIQVDNPDNFEDKLNEALSDPESANLSRQKMVKNTYHLQDGRAAIRAAEAIVEVLGKED